jgi:hypothetical protein
VITGQAKEVSVVVSWVGVRFSPLGASTIIGVWYQPRMMDDDECGAIGGMIGRGNGNFQRKPALMPRCRS